MIAVSIILCALQGTVPDTKYGCDSSAIKWTLPGNFKAAQKQAIKEKRLLILKGVSFGIDKLGASDATCGTW